MISPSEQVATCLSQSRSFTTALGDGDPLVWQRWGEGSSEFRPLVLLHGGFGSWNHWLANLPALMAQRQVWTLDLPGLGASGDMPEPHTTRHFAELIWHGLAELLGPEARPMNSWHHQAVDEVGEGLRVNCRARDGVIEGLESSEGKPLLALQSHPENCFEDYPDFGKLFTWLIESAGR